MKIIKEKITEETDKEINNKKENVKEEGTAISLDRVTKIYSGSSFPAVDQISLALERGTVTAILGPSGCGKTTLLRLIAGFEIPDGGTISLAGHVVAGPGAWVPPEKRKAGMVFQDYALFPHLTVEQNILFALTGDARKKLPDILELAGLNGLEKRYPHELSGGQQQRTALARALIRDPVVLLLDELFSNLDAGLRSSMRREVNRIIRQARATALLVTHDQKDALAFSDRVAVIRAGRLEQVGSPEEVYRFPATEFVASFVGQSNILQGVVGADGISVDTAVGKIPCYHNHDLPPGAAVKVSVRPESLVPDPAGEIAGAVAEIVYGGSEIEAALKVPLPGGGELGLLVRLHPKYSLTEGQVLRLKVLPEFVAVIER